ncbi:MAG: hypothetical protein M1832_004852 [Thelocarpon impressellum]|nr:MAG: hypothetical protein M1832_004852 [Thelocarpon impressellum]
MHLLAALAALLLVGPASGLPREVKPGATCNVDERNPLYLSYYLQLNNWPQDPRGCGRGLLDNLRGQCGIITNWECEYTNDTTARPTFKTMNLASKENCVRDAVYLASPETSRVTPLTCHDAPPLNRAPGAASAKCTWRPSPRQEGRRDYTVQLKNWARDERGCGRGLLDNLRGQCGGEVKGWKCDVLPNEPQIEAVSFSNSLMEYEVRCVPDAIYLASWGQVDLRQCR